MTTPLSRVLRASLLAVVVSLLHTAPARALTIVIRPYVQPGEQAEVGSKDSKVIAFATDNAPADFVIEYSWEGAAPQRAPAKSVLVQIAPGKEIKVPPGQKVTDPDLADERPTTIPATAGMQLLNYRADLKDLPLNTKVNYRVLRIAAADKPGDKPVEREILAATFLSRKPPDAEISFDVFGDSGRNSPEQKRVAFEMSKTKPEFLINVGDNVYTEGRLSQYLTKFWPIYGNEKDTADKGVNLLASTPFYMTFGNHDVASTDLAKFPDGLAGFFSFYFPLNGPADIKGKPKLGGPKDRIEWFKTAAGDRFPKMANYSFDDGPAHFLVLDANSYIDLNDKAIRKYITDDLAATKLPWKFVVFHQPPFGAAKKHEEDERMRTFAPLFEAGGVDMVLCGHIHNYQRSKPLKFAPKTDAKGNINKAAGGLIVGDFTIDNKFDGKTATKPDGVIYMITGASGGELHDEKINDTPDKWAKWTANYNSKKCSFASVQLSPTKLVWKQIDDKGNLMEEFTVSK